MTTQHTTTSSMSAIVITVAPIVMSASKTEPAMAALTEAAASASFSLSSPAKAAATPLSKEEVREWGGKVKKAVAEISPLCLPKGPMDEVIDNIFLGGFKAAKDIRYLEKNGITHVVNCAAGDKKLGTQFYRSRRSSIFSLEIEAEDESDYDMTMHAKQVIDFVQAALSGSSKNRVLVHCAAGINRSTTMVMCYLMSVHRMPLLEAARLCSKKRGSVLSNEGFRNQLAIFANNENLLL